jgi:hypothetical protein
MERVEGFETKWRFDIEQGSPAWHKIKADKISATGAECLMVNELGKKDQYVTIIESEKSGEFAKGCLTMLQGKIDAKRGKAPKRSLQQSDAMLWGSMMEEKSRALYEEKTGRTTYEVGFVDCVGYNIGVSPDGGVDDEKRAIEIKNYNTKKVNKIVETGKIPKDAYLQMQTQLLVMNFDVCDFVLTDFHDEADHEYTCIEVQRDEELIAVLKDKLIKASKYIDDQAVVEENESIAWLFDEEELW